MKDQILLLVLELQQTLLILQPRREINLLDPWKISDFTKEKQAKLRANVQA